MTYISEAGSRRRLGILNAGDTEFLAGMLEHRTGDDASFWIDTDMLEAMAAQGAPQTLLDILGDAVSARGGLDVVLSNPLPPVTVRYTRRSAVSLQTPPVDEGEVEAVEDASEESSAVEEDDGGVEGSEYRRDGMQLRCAMCSNAEFTHRQVAVRSYPGDDLSAAPVDEFADCRVCTECGHVHWFLGTGSDGDG